MEAWTINGDSYPNAKVAPLIRGRRYRLQFINKSMDDHPLHLHRHSFELRTLGVPLAAAGGAVPQDIRGIMKDVVLIDAQTRAEVEFTADNPGASLFHCHQQNHMDLGFMMLFGMRERIAASAAAQSSASRSCSHRFSRVPRPITRSRSTGPRRSRHRP